MSRAVKKKSRRLWRNIRKTLGTMFLVSALVVAAIPVDYLQAEGEGTDATADETPTERPNTTRDKMKVSIATASLNETATGNWGATSIPDVLTNPGFLNGQNTPKIYKSENLNFSFVVHNIHNDAQYAVIVGYDNQNQLNNVGNQLTIPATLDAYAPYDGYSCALGGRNGEFLFYKTEMVREEARDADGKFLGYKLDADKGIEPSNITQEKYYYLDEYHPCYFRTRDTWKDLEYVANRTDGRTSAASLFFIEGLTPEKLESVKGDLSLLTEYDFNEQGIPTANAKNKWVAANEVSVERIKNIPVYYIGNQYVDADNKIQNVVSKQKDDQGVDQIVGKGIFSTATVSSLVVEPNLVGIGNYAFAGTHISTVELSDSVVEIGNHAFSGCDSLSSFTIGANALNVVIGDHAFYNCSGLTEFDACNVLKIGDSAFEACRNLAKVNLLRPGAVDDSESGGEAEPTISGSLSSIGYYAFAYCVALGELILPNTYGESDIRVSTFEGCTSLKHIYATGETTRVNFVDNDNYYSFRDFRQGVDSTFYFEGPKGSALENTAITNYFVFKYSDEEIYEKKIPDESSTLSADGFYALNAIFEVTRIDEGNTGKVTNVIIDSGLKNLNIPGQVGPLAVAEIAEGGFRNNTVLTNVTIPASLTKIGTEAFQGCYNLKNVLFVDPSNLTIEANAFKTQEGSPSTATPVLNFIGPISTETVQCGSFEYAMDPANNINAGSQPADVYITYYSGWPTNLKVQYDPVTDRNTLLEYPTLTNLLKGIIAPQKDADGHITSCKVQNNHYNADTYYYMTDEYQAAAINAAKKCLGIWDSGVDMISDNDTKEPSTYEQQIIDATLNINLPAGIEAVKAGLFRDSEAEEKKTIESKQNEGKPVTIPVKTVTTYGLRDVPENAFEKAEYLSSVALLGNIESIGKYAFKDCANLMAVSVAPNATTMGVAPFIGCDKLTNVDFQGGPNFTCDRSIIYSLNEDGTKKALIEYLNSRGSSTVESSETAGITEIYPEAFRNTDVYTVDLGNAQFATLPKGVFQDTESGTPGLQTVILPVTCATIEEDAFTDSKIRNLTVPNMRCILDEDMFKNTSGNANEYTDLGSLIIQSPDGSLSQAFAQKIGDDNWREIAGYYIVNFWGYDEETGEDDGKLIKGYDYVQPGTAVQKPDDSEVPEWPNHTFRGWDSEDYQYVTRNLDIKAIYADGYRVVFYDEDWTTVLFETEAKPGTAVNPPVYNNDEEERRITTWRNKATGELLSASELRKLIVTEDLEFIAGYGNVPGDPDDPNNPDDPSNPSNPDDPNNPSNPSNPGNPGGPAEGQHTLEVLNGSGSGYYAKDEQIIITANAPADGMEFSEWDVSPADTVITDKTRSVTIITMPDKDVAVVAVYKPKGTGSDNSGYHSLLVHNGSGSGSYVPGAQIIITANEPGRGQTFSGWTVSPADTVVTDKTLASAIITMPNHDVAVIANFKGGTTSTTVGGSTGSGNTTSGTGTGTNTRPGGSSSTGGTTVVIDKNGLSNTGVVSATVNGSSDNFTIKVTESSAAAEAALKALQAEYGSLDNIKYFPMDISLYDSTGNTKITDTTGLSVNITLPLPDSLIQYAGNNKVAGVVNDRLDKLNPRFSTINGVACITFTAEHFSPYLIYVDVTNLSDGTISDSTPKTGDGIHPKWFLSIGLACLSFVMFMVKDNKGDSKKKQKVAVRARN